MKRTFSLVTLTIALVVGCSGQAARTPNFKLPQWNPFDVLRAGALNDSSLSNTGLNNIPYRLDMLLNRWIDKSKDTVPRNWRYMRAANGAVWDGTAANHLSFSGPFLSGGPQLDIYPSGTVAVRTMPYGVGAGQTSAFAMGDITNGKYVGLKAPDAVLANKIWTWPGSDGSSGQVLVTDGSGILSFSDAGSAILPSNVAYEDSANVFTEDQTIAVDKSLIFTNESTPFHIKNQDANGDLEFIYDVGGPSAATKAKIGLGGLLVDTISSLSGGALVIGQGMKPSATNSYDLGTSSLKWKDIYLAGNVASGTWAGSTIGVSVGGTGSSSLTANNVLLGNGTSALQTVAPGTSGNVLTSNGTTWQSTAPGSVNHNILSSTHSDANTGTVVRGDLIVGNSTPKWDRLAKGSANQVLRMDGSGVDPGYGSINIASSAAVTGVLGYANGGTAASSYAGTGTGRVVTDGGSSFNTRNNFRYSDANDALLIGGGSANTTAPAVGLRMMGDNNDIRLYLDATTSGTTLNNRIIFRGSAGTIASPSATGSSGLPLGQIGWSTVGSGSTYKDSVAQIIVTLDAVPSGSSTPTRMEFSTTSSGSTVSSRRVTIASSGNVGIGDLTPAALLTVGSGDLFQVNSSGNVPQYNGVATVERGIPSEVATVHLTAQSAAITATTLYAVPASGAGVYRVNWYASVTTAASTSSTLGGTNGFQVVATDPDDNVAKTVPGTIVAGLQTNSNNSTSTGTISGSYTIRAKASTNIEYQMDYTSSGGTAMQYNLTIVLDAL